MKRQLTVGVAFVGLMVLTVLVLLEKSFLIIPCLIADGIVFWYFHQTVIEKKQAERVYNGCKKQYKRFIDFYQSKNKIEYSNIYFEISNNPDDYLKFLGHCILRYDARLKVYETLLSKDQKKQIGEMMTNVKSIIGNC